MNAKPMMMIMVCLALMMGLFSAASAEKLNSIVAYTLTQIGPRLDKAENLISRDDPQNALSYYSTAKTEWDGIFRDYKGQFNTNHPDIVAMQKRFDKVAALLAAAGALQGETAQQNKPQAAPASPAHETQAAAVQPKQTASANAPQEKLSVPAGQAPPATMLYVMKQVDAALDGVQDDIDAQHLEAAKKDFHFADQDWQAQLEWNKGQYDPNHPLVVALVTKYNRVKDGLASLGSESASANENLPAVLGAIKESEKNLNAAYQEARGSFRDVSSLMSDFDSGSEDDVDKLRVKIDVLNLRAERVNALLPGALAAAKAFRRQYPDFSQLNNLVKDGSQAGQAVEKLEKFPRQWLSDGSLLINEALGYADENIKQYGVGRLGAITGKDEALQVHAADNAEQWVLTYSAFLLEVVPSILPELPAEAQAVLPEFASARQGFEQRAAPMRADIAQVASAVAKTRKNVADAAQRRLEQARFPQTEYKTGGAAKDIKRAWAEAIPDKKLLKISVYRPYEERTEARWHQDKWIVNTYRYIGANCLAQLPSGKYMVYRMNFRNTQQSGGGWSPLKHWSVGHVYEILAENIDK